MMVENCAKIGALLALSFCLPVIAQEYQGWQFDSLHVHSSFQIFWQGLWRAKQHYETNGLLQQNNDLAAKNHQLLELIRRQLLTPAERIAEDAVRRIVAAEHRRRVEAQRIRDAKTAKLTRIVCLSIAGVFLLSIIGASLFSPKVIASPAPQIRGATLVETAPAPIDQAQAEREANWQHILDMRAAAAAPTPAPAATPVPLLTSQPPPSLTFPYFPNRSRHGIACSTIKTRTSRIRGSPS